MALPVFSSLFNINVSVKFYSQLRTVCVSRLCLMFAVSRSEVIIFLFIIFQSSINPIKKIICYKWETQKYIFTLFTLRFIIQNQNMFYKTYPCLKSHPLGLSLSRDALEFCQSHCVQFATKLTKPRCGSKLPRWYQAG